MYRVHISNAEITHDIQLFVYVSVFFLIKKNPSDVGSVCGSLVHRPHHTQEWGPPCPPVEEPKGGTLGVNTSKIQDGEWSPIHGEDGEQRPWGDCGKQTQLALVRHTDTECRLMIAPRDGAKRVGAASAQARHGV